LNRGEIERFYDQGGLPLFDEILHLVNRQALIPFFRRRFRNEGRILDAGAGDGSLAVTLGIVGAVYIDLSGNQVRRCRDRIGFGLFVQADLRHLPFRANFFDAVICSNVLHYAELAGMEEILRVTKERGRMLVSFLEDSPFTRMIIAWGAGWGFFPPSLAAAGLIELSSFLRLGFTVRESATIVFVPPLFQARRDLPRLGFVAFDLEKMSF
jgi:2-polyprenyl-3-methyl-5-hydroxy-6-metoxy-1,4-benzoquinol methylase